MNWAKQRSLPSLPWFTVGISLIFLLSIALRFWGLNRFNTLVFDEVYYAKFGNSYLTKGQFFDAHPPLGKYLIAIGIWLSGYFPFGDDTTKNWLAGSLLSPWNYRWMNAIAGSFIPLIVAAIAYQLAQGTRVIRQNFALVAGLFAAADGFFLVESRYALINLYLVLFGLLGHLCFLIALNRQKQRWFWLTLAGVAFGASISVKWNGLGFLIGAYLVWIVAWIFRGFSHIQEWMRSRTTPISKTTQRFIHHPWQSLTQLNPLILLITLVLIPMLVYRLIWIPHIQLNPEYNFWEVQKQILGYHQRVKDGSDVHPYCSKWYTWPLMIRPIVYFYETAINASDSVPMNPPLPSGVGQVIYAVHAMGNPVLWWLSIAAMVVLLLALGLWIFTQFRFHPTAADGVNFPGIFPASIQVWVPLYLIINWSTNFLPWSKVTRCVFIYHYMGSAVFSSLAIAWLVQRWLVSPQPALRGIGVTAIFLVLLAFVFWMPIYLGLPISYSGWLTRMWFSSWH